MGMIKRIFRQTSQKLLNKLGAHRGSHQFVLNGSAPVAAHTQVAQLSGASKRARRNSKRQLKKSGTIPEALLLAAKNYLPPVQFHHVHGPNAQLSKNKFVARRTQSFCQALVFSNRVILPNERVYIKVLDIAKGWSGTIRFGFTSIDPATLLYQMPKHACPDMTNAGHTWARALADEVVRRNSVIHFSYNTNGYIHYGINNQDFGIFYANVNTSQHLWFVVDIYGLTAAVELVDPRVHNGNSSDLDFSRIRSADNNGRSTMCKSTSTMDNFHLDVAPGRSKKKRTSRKAAAVHPTLIYEQWPPEILFMSSPDNPSRQRPALPNLNSIIIPPSQQNIYSPMPSLSAKAANPLPPQRVVNDTHDYYQIMTHDQPNQTRQLRRALKIQPATKAPVSNTSAASTSSAVNSPTATTSTPKTKTTGRIRNIVADEKEICQQLEGLQIIGSSVSKSSKPASMVNMLPVAAARKGQGSSVKPKARQSIKASQKSLPSSSSLSRDNNNNSPPGKDCPICFERPINCVLYQCGHMCTCYECGVKQWKTQSRTCPICRTIIKDVIKTYMS